MVDKNFNEILIDEKITDDLINRSKNNIQALTHLFKNKFRILDRYSKTKIKITISNRRTSIVHTHLINVFKNMFLDDE